MDYKYIEQLLDRYWDAETSTEEESILKDFFQQTELPVHLQKYQAIFCYEYAQKNVGLGADFNEKMMKQIAPAGTKALRISFVRRLRPLYRAVAIVAIVLTLGNAIQHAYTDENKSTSIVSTTYKPAPTDPQIAYEKPKPAEADTLKPTFTAPAEVKQ